MANVKLTVVMMAGLPCAGKTTLSRGLEHALGWQVIDKDMYRNRLLSQGVHIDDASKEAYERSFSDIRVALEEHRESIIFDTAGLNRFILDKVLEIIASVPETRLKVILCVVERDLRNDRLRQRKEPHTRITVQPDTTGDYLKYFDHLPQDKLTIYTHEPFEECLMQAIAYIQL